MDKPRLAVSLLLVALLGLPSAPPAQESGSDPTDPGLKAAVAALREAGSYEEQFVGYLGTTPDVWRHFETLRGRATADQLVAFSAAEEPVLRTYAVRALATVAPERLPAVLRAHLDDDTRVETMSGCMVGESMVGDLMLRAGWEHLGEEDREALAVAMVEEDSPLSRRARELETRRFPVHMLHRIRALAEAGEDAALVALARYGVRSDAERIAAALKREGELGDFRCALLAAGLLPDARYLDPLEELLPQAQAARREGALHRTVLLERALRSITDERALHLLVELQRVQPKR